MEDETIKAKLDGLASLIEEKFKRNEDQHNSIADGVTLNKLNIEVLNHVQDEYKPMWADIKEERRAWRNRIFDFAWKIFASAVFAASLLPEVARRFSYLFDQIA